jgi:hypothetical protein
VKLFLTTRAERLALALVLSALGLATTLTWFWWSL